MTEYPQCPQCGMDNTYHDGTTYVCPDCSFEFVSADGSVESDMPISKDCNGTPLEDGDSVTVIKDLKVKGSSMVVKQGTKVKSIRLTEDPDLVDCKIDGSAIVLRTEFLKKG